MTPILRLAVTAFALGSMTVLPPAAEAKHTVELLTDVYTVDQIYRSMMGPDGVQQGVFLETTEKPELLWITGYEAIMVGEDGASPKSQEFMCHNTLSLNRELEERYRLYGNSNYGTRRLFTLSQGQTRIDFPKGFGIPILSTEPLMLQSQVLNLNEKDTEHRIRHKVRVDYLHESELDGPMQPLMLSYAYVVTLVEDQEEVPKPGEFMHGDGCRMAEPAGDVVHSDTAGHRFTQHWVVPPGRQESRSIVTPSMRLPFDTTAHYISVHLHPFGESLELRDLTTGESVFKSTTLQAPDKIGLAHVDWFESKKGIPLYKDHEYELVTVYNNTTDEDQDAMALMFLYVLDKAYRHPLRPEGGEATSSN
jgi:hypothetical protein